MTTMISRQKDKVRDVIYAQRDDFVSVAQDLHDHPELAFCEEVAAARLTEFLEAEGFSVRKDICGMPTAFVATFGHGPLHIAFCAEYDALPPACLYDRSRPPELVEVWLTPERQDAPLRHACGHNLIAGAAVAAAIGLRDIADEVGLTISVFGTPGEELYGLPEPREGHLAPGKVILFEAGAFDGVHALLMVHPFPTPWSIFIPTCISPRLRASFSKGSVDAHSIGVTELKRLEENLKQTIFSFHQIPGLFVARPETESVGAQADILWIASSVEAAEPVSESVRCCFEEAATAAKVSVEITEFARGAQMRNDPMLSKAYRRNSEVLGRIRGQEEYIQTEVREILSSPKLPVPVRLIARYFPQLVSPPGLFMSKFPVKILFGTDLANVSEVIPAIHPMIGVGGTSGPHMAEFADDIETDEAFRAMLDGGITLAWTALDAAINPTIRNHLIESAKTRKEPSPRIY